MTNYESGDEFDVQQEIDLYIEGDLQTVYAEYAEITSDTSDPENISVTMYDAVGNEITTDSVTEEDLQEAEGDWLHPRN